MSADRLREAAKVLRCDAGAARRDADGPWTWRVTADGKWAVVIDSEGQWMAQVDDDDRAAYIATMHPSVGLALADWLDREATFTGYMTPEANRIADLILGSTS